jgi:ATP-dependent protease ClpP protease subunit
MNKRQRDILAALQPCVEFAMARDAGHGGEPASRRDSVPGLALHKRVSAEAPAEIFIYGTIGGGGWFSEGISASDVVGLLREAGPGPVNVRINSGGGDVFDGIAIHSLLSRHPGTVTTYVDGLAASAASFIMLAGDRVVSSRNALIMIHDGMTGTYGNQATHDRASELLGLASDNIADLYAERAGEDASHWRNLMTVNGEDGTWYTGVSAMEAGLVDEVTQVSDDEDNESVAAHLAGWQDRLPASLAAKISFPADRSLPADPQEENAEQDIAVAWNAKDFLELMKGALA